MFRLEDKVRAKEWTMLSFTRVGKLAELSMNGGPAVSVESQVSVRVCVFMYLLVYVSTCLCIYLSMYLHVYVYVCLCIYMYICVSICLCIYVYRESGPT